MMATINFNGKSYNNPDEMPPNEREAYNQMMSMFVDKNGNGIPDFLEGDMVKNVMSAYSTQVDVNGNTYNSLDDLPPEMRQKVQGAFTKLSEAGILPQSASLPGMQSSPAVSREPMVTSRPFVSREYNPTIQEDKGMSPAIWVGIGIAVLACCAGTAAVVAFFLAAG
jgi:hypothetical protein